MFPPVFKIKFHSLMNMHQISLCFDFSTFTTKLKRKLGQIFHVFPSLQRGFSQHKYYY